MRGNEAVEAENLAVAEAMPRLAPALLRRFESDKGYEPFPEALTSRELLRSLS